MTMDGNPQSELLDDDGLIETEIVERATGVFELLKLLPLQDQVPTLNAIRLALHDASPFRDEPVDCVQWVPAGQVHANDYNPNSVAPPEMKLLAHSILADGYTQPIVAWLADGYEVVDGFHRNRVGKENADVQARLHGYLPLVVIRQDREARNDRIAATIRHNRARGKHRVEAMSDIVLELKRRNWSNDRIARELGMDADEILRLCQITGLAEAFADQEFSQAWDIEGQVTEADYIALTDSPDQFDEDTLKTRVANTGDEQRVFHTYDQWECYKAGFYATTKEGMSREQCEEIYREFLTDLDEFETALNGVINEWPHSCEHYLTNSAMNRIAWLGQAACCYARGIPAVYRGGFSLLTEEQQAAANEVALTYLNKWLVSNEREAVPMDVAYSGRQMDIY